MYKKIIALISSCILIFSLCSCGKVESTKNENEVIIKFSWWGTESRYDKTMKAIKLFESKNPNIKVKAEFGEWTGFKKRMSMKIAGNDEPDLMQINYDWLENFSKDGTGFYDLNKLSDSISLDNFSKDILKYGTKNNILNAIPISMNSKVMYYNSGTGQIKTWTELLASGNPNGDKYLLNSDPFNLWTICMAYVQEKNNKNFINDDGSLGFTQGDIEELLSFYKSMVDNKVVPVDTIKDTDIFTNNGCQISWSSDASKFEKAGNGETTVSGFPSASGENNIRYVKPSMLYAISKNSEHPKEAAQLMDFMLNDKEASMILGMDRGVPSSKMSNEVLNDNGELTGLQVEANKASDSVKDILISPYYENTLIKNICEEAMKEVAFGKSSPKDCSVKTYDDLVKTLQTIVK